MKTLIFGKCLLPLVLLPKRHITISLFSLRKWYRCAGQLVYFTGKVESLRVKPIPAREVLTSQTKKCLRIWLWIESDSSSEDLLKESYVTRHL